jgi:hypothetical protein
LEDPDFLIELAWSKKGGWWISGSIEQTLLSSADGIEWTPAPLDRAISSLISSYVVNRDEIWLAAVLSDGPERDF